MSEGETEQPIVKEDFAWRIERYVELGFSVNEAEILANSKQKETAKDRHGTKKLWTTPLDWMRVKKATDNGCSHTQALEIFVTSPEGL